MALLPVPPPCFPFLPVTHNHTYNSDVRAYSQLSLHPVSYHMIHHGARLNATNTPVATHTSPLYLTDKLTSIPPFPQIRGRCGELAAAGLVMAASCQFGEAPNWTGHGPGTAKRWEERGGRWRRNAPFSFLLPSFSLSSSSSSLFVAIPSLRKERD